MRRGKLQVIVATPAPIRIVAVPEGPTSTLPADVRTLVPRARSARVRTVVPSLVTVAVARGSFAAAAS